MRVEFGKNGVCFEFPPDEFDIAEQVLEACITLYREEGMDVSAIDNILSAIRNGTTFSLN